MRATYIKLKKNILKPGMEMMELEELQGDKGLEALRVGINMELHFPDMS